MEVNRSLAVIHQEMDWLQSVIDQAICTYLQQDGHESSWLDIPDCLICLKQIAPTLIA